MGLFSGKKKTYVNMSVSRMLEDSDIIPISKAALLDYTFSNNKRVDALADSYVDYLNNHTKNSIGSKVIALDNWANKKYHYGALRSNTFAEGQVNLKEELRSFLSDLLDQSVTVGYAKFGPLNNNHFVYKILIDHFGFNIKSNQASVETLKNGYTTYLESFKIYYCSQSIKDSINIDYFNPLGYSSQSGKTHSRIENRKAAHTQWEEDELASEDYAIITFSYFNGTVEVKYDLRINFLAYEYSGEVIVPEAGASPDEEAPVLDDLVTNQHDYYMVRYITPDNEVHLFTYQYGLGTINQLDNLFLLDVDPGTHIPNVYLRLGRRDLYELEDEAAKSSRVYCNKLGFNYAKVSKQIMDSIEDKQDIEDIFLSFRLDPNDDDPISAEYFYHHFEELYKNADAERAKADDKASALDYIATQSLGGLSYTVADNTTRINCTYRAIGYKDVQGNIGKVGSFVSVIGDMQIRSNGIFSSIPSIRRNSYRKQISETLYREYFVDGLTINQSLTSGHYTSSTKDDGNLYIPVDLELIAKKLRKHRHWLISKSFVIVVTTVKVVKTKWYQTGIFKVIMFVIAVVIAFFTAGQGMIWYLALLKAIAITVVMHVAVMAISAILTALGIDASIVAVVVAVIALAVGAYAQAANTTVGGLSATQLMAVANTSFAVSHNHIALNAKRSIQSFEEFKLMIEGEMDSIEEQRKLLGLEDGGKIDIYTLLADQVRKPDIRLGESPISFYERTLAVNVGLATTTLLNHFVLISLQLPSFESFMAKRRESYV